MYQDYDKIQATLLHQWIKKNQIKFKEKREKEYYFYLEGLRYTNNN